VAIGNIPHRSPSPSSRTFLLGRAVTLGGISGKVSRTRPEGGSALATVTGPGGLDPAPGRSRRDCMLPETCPSCDVAWGMLPDEHSAVMDPRTFRMECQGTVSPEHYARLDTFRMTILR
jgi:hypothetical protein